MTAALRFIALCGCFAAAAIAIGVFTATNTVPSTNVGQQQFPINANALEPAACSALNLTTIVAGANGTAGNDLILGPSAASTLNGNGGIDCIIGGGGNDTINGNGNGANNSDVCIGGPGNDTFKKCKTTIQ
jgi:Ca2+-binding RTX toxin-like protein